MKRLGHLKATLLPYQLFNPQYEYAGQIDLNCIDDFIGLDQTLALRLKIK